MTNVATVNDATDLANGSIWLDNNRFDKDSAVKLEIEKNGWSIKEKFTQRDTLNIMKL